MNAKQAKQPRPGVRAALAELQAKPNHANEPQAADTLRRGLAAKDPRIVTEAASFCGEHRLSALADDLGQAFDRFADELASADADCLAKTTIVEALHRMEYDALDTFRRGMTFYWPERPFTGRRDRAVLLRIASAKAFTELAQLPSFDLLEPLIELLGDPVPQVRAAAAIAVGELGSREGVGVLRLTASLDSSSYEVVDACFAALFRCDPESSTPFVSRFLKIDDEQIRAAAAFALAESKTDTALEALIQEWSMQSDIDFRKDLVYAMSLTRTDKAVDFLVSLIESGDDNSEDVIRSLAPHKGVNDISERIAAAVRNTGNPMLLRSFHEAFGVPNVRGDEQRL